VKMFSNILLSSIKSELAFSNLLLTIVANVPSWLLTFPAQHPAMLDHLVFTMTPLHYHTVVLVASFKLLPLHVTSSCITLVIGWP
jgi:hypothetical protein